MIELEALPPTGLIDIHSHLLPGVDDGCATMEDSLTCVRRLMQLGYVGTICTSHCGDDFFPENTPTHLQARLVELQHLLQHNRIQYQLWLGSELRLSKKTPEYLREHGACTLAGSKNLLMDVWDPSWPKWAPSVIRELMQAGYQPIMAHPERMACQGDLDKSLRVLEDMGVWLQGNFRCMTGEEGYQADQMIRKWLKEGRYRFLALDMHGPDSLEGRFDGLRLVEAEFGKPAVIELSEQAPRQWLLAQPGI